MDVPRSPLNGLASTGGGIPVKTRRTLTSIHRREIGPPVTQAEAWFALAAGHELAGFLLTNPLACLFLLCTEYTVYSVLRTAYRVHGSGLPRA